MKKNSLILIFSFLLLACSKRQTFSGFSEPPPTPLLAIESRWAVVASSYVQVFDIPSDRAVVLGFYRKGAIIPVAERISLGEKKGGERWLRNEGDFPGWLREKDCLVYETKSKAETSANLLLQ